MSAFSNDLVDQYGMRVPATMRAHRAAKRAAAEERNAQTPPERRRVHRRLAALGTRAGAR